METGVTPGVVPETVEASTLVPAFALSHRRASDGFPSLGAGTSAPLLDDAMSLGSDELWLLSLAAGSLAIVLVAVLFGLVIAVLQRVDRHAARTHTAAKQIAQNTVSLWALDQMNRDLVAIRDAARGAARAGNASAVVAPLSAVAQKVEGWLGGSDHDEDKSS